MIKSVVVFVFLLTIEGVLSRQEREEAVLKDERRGSRKCKNPTGNLWTSVLKGCGQAVCRKKGKKAVWEVCPNPATKEDLQRVDDSLNTLKGTDENILASLKVLEKKLENICDAFNITPAPPTTGADKCVCGIEAKRRIVGGQEVVRGRYPWIASVTWSSRPRPKKYGGCGATLIASRWAITAGHCNYLYKDPPGIHIDDPIRYIVLGEHNISTIDALDTNRLEVEVVDIFEHPQYDPDYDPYDIALLHLKDEVDLSVHTPACLPTEGKDYTGQMGVALGWGRLGACIRPNYPILQEVTLEIVSDAECRKAEGTYEALDKNNNCQNYTDDYSDSITDDMLCAGSPGKDSCNGDSGGPLTVKESGQHTLAGVVSWGDGCAEANFFGVFAEVAHSSLRTWINDTIANNGGAIFCETI